MKINKPGREYLFYQDKLKVTGLKGLRYEIRGDPDYPGNYTVGGVMIVPAYNASRHWRPQDELNRMGQINEAYHQGDAALLSDLVEHTKETFRRNGSAGIRKMWDRVFELYSQ